MTLFWFWLGGAIATLATVVAVEGLPCGLVLAADWILGALIWPVAIPRAAYIWRRKRLRERR